MTHSEKKSKHLFSYQYWSVLLVCFNFCTKKSIFLEQFNFFLCKTWFLFPTSTMTFLTVIIARFLVLFFFPNCKQSHDRANLKKKKKKFCMSEIIRKVNIRAAVLKKLEGVHYSNGIYHAALQVGHTFEKINKYIDTYFL